MLLQNLQPALHLLAHRGGQFRQASTSADVKAVLSSKGKLTCFPGAASSWKFQITHQSMSAVSLPSKQNGQIPLDPTEKSPIKPVGHDDVEMSTPDDIVSCTLHEGAHVCSFEIIIIINCK